MTNVSITIRLSPKDIELIDEMVEKGYFTNRSDAIRNSMRTHLRGIEAERKQGRNQRSSKAVKLRSREPERKLELHERILLDAFGSD